MNEPVGHTNAAALLATLPPEWQSDLFSDIQARVRDLARLVVVLDDDPTGTQTVNNVPVLTRWDDNLLRTELQHANTVLYVLTNSRSLPAREAFTLNYDIATRLLAHARAVGRDVRLISRSDSTLRGHYPVEIQALTQALHEAQQPVAAHLIIPCFVEGGRLTVNAVHWLRDGDDLVPSAQTEFARDKDFGFVHSDLREWVAEKTHGAVKPEQVNWLSLAELRTRGPNALAAHLEQLRGPAVVDAVTYRDLEVLVDALLQAEEHGSYFLYRTAASFVRVYGGIGLQNLLNADALVSERNGSGGLILAGSFTSRTTRQLEELRATEAVTAIPLQVERLLDSGQRQAEIERVREQADDAVAHGHTTLVYTSREVVTADTHLEIGKQISDSLSQVVRELEATPRYIVAKGGITSSDIATDGLGVRRAWVLGQIEPGVPVWRLDETSRFPFMTYVVFPGNVGDDFTLARIIAQLDHSHARSNP